MQSLMSPRGFLAAGLFALISVLLFTRIGVFIVFDLLGDFRGTDNFNTTAAEAPLELDRELTPTRQIILPEAIEQASGLYRSEGLFAISTDQTELFLMGSDGSEILSKTELVRWTPLVLKQGSVEAMTLVGDELWFIGETSAFVRTDREGALLDPTPLPPQMEGREFTGLTAEGNSLFVTASDGPGITVLGSNGEFVRDMALDFGDRLKTGRDAGELLWSGVAAFGGALYLICENFPIIVVASPRTGEVAHVLGIKGGGEFSDISVFGGEAFLSSDHNYFDPRPPITVIDLARDVK